MIEKKKQMIKDRINTENGNYMNENELIFDSTVETRLDVPSSKVIIIVSTTTYWSNEHTYANEECIDQNIGESRIESIVVVPYRQRNKSAINNTSLRCRTKPIQSPRPMSGSGREREPPPESNGGDMFALRHRRQTSYATVEGPRRRSKNKKAARTPRRERRRGRSTDSRSIQDY